MVQHLDLFFVDDVNEVDPRMRLGIVERIEQGLTTADDAAWVGELIAAAREVARAFQRWHPAWPDEREIDCFMASGGAYLLAGRTSLGAVRRLQGVMERDHGAR